MKLQRRYIEKPWGRTELPPIFEAPKHKRIGEISFTNGGDLPLLAKYIFTSERLSVQVHPDDDQARARGLARGKSECWYILEAGPGSELGLGLKREMSADALRRAALDGSVVDLMEWHRVRAGDFYFVPAGTIHAIGGNLSLFEFQQNLDVTYRLYDYGRPRELHVDDAVAIARRGPYPATLAQRISTDEEHRLVESPPFTLVVSRKNALQGRRRWVIPLEGEVRSGSDVAIPGDCLLLEARDTLEGDARMLIGATA